MIRGLFIPEEGCKWGSFDYASQEPRWLAHYCSTLKGANRHPQIDDVVKMYNDGEADFHQMVADIAGISRKQAKTVNLGIMYGMGRGKLAGVMDITEDEAKELLGQYHDKVPFVKGIADFAMDRAQNVGHIRTCWVVSVGLTCGNLSHTVIIKPYHWKKQRKNMVVKLPSNVLLHTRHSTD